MFQAVEGLKPGTLQSCASASRDREQRLSKDFGNKVRVGNKAVGAFYFPLGTEPQILEVFDSLSQADPVNRQFHLSTISPGNGSLVITRDNFPTNEAAQVFDQKMLSYRRPKTTRLAELSNETLNSAERKGKGIVFRGEFYISHPYKTRTGEVYDQIKARVKRRVVSWRRNQDSVHRH
ncbi:MAG TPA: hypothetical protein VJC10_00685 [Patescibacteria group bacterium]|nr:hypothetical protein [Patescibacteria group bacterium]